MLLLFFFFSLVLGARRGVADQKGHDAALWGSITFFFLVYYRFLLLLLLPLICRAGAAPIFANVVSGELQQKKQYHLLSYSCLSFFLFLVTPCAGVVLLLAMGRAAL